VTNREHLEEEAGDLLCMLQLMMEMGVLSEKKVYDAALQKRAKLHKWSNIFTHDVTTE
jgi:NTP pyrophosphatase (non-canonical NTP hydrolase)